MPRITELDPSNASAEARALFERDIAARGFVLNGTKIGAYRPEIAQAAKRLGASVADGGLIDAQLRLLMNVRIASIVGCPF